MNYVFVYGTLMKNERNHYLLNDSEFIGNGYIKNYFMFNVSTYPGIQMGEGKVYGEVYKIDETTEKLLDELEEAGYLYDKKTAKVYLDNNTNINAYVYVYILKNHPNDLHLSEYKWQEIKKV